jgi:hypothetical protein
MERVELTNVKYTHKGDTSRNPFRVNSVGQDYKIGTVRGYLWKWGGWMEEMKVREYG